MDFYQIVKKTDKNGVIEIYPDFKTIRSKDLMIRGKSFYAVWDEEKGLWSTDEYDVQRLIDKDLDEYYKQLNKNYPTSKIKVKRMLYFSTNIWKNYRNFLREMSDSSVQLDNQLTFMNTEVRKKDYVSKRLQYNLEEGSFSAYDEIIGTLYSEEEREKLEWAIGAIIAGDAKDIQKFIVLYGEAGSGKSTFLNIVQKLFEGYYTTFEAKALTGSNNAFSTEPFKTNPLVAIQHDGDLSKIEDNTKLNSIVAHEEMIMNEKYRPSYSARSNAFLFMGTNKPVRITDAKSGIIRRLIDVRPSGMRIPNKRYHILMNQVSFELGAIAYHCLQVYRTLGKNYYSSYKPLEMMYQTDVFFNFIESNYYIFKEQDGVTLSQAYEMYKTYCDESLIEFKLPRHKFREELKSYFDIFHEVIRLEGKQVRSYYSGFITDRFTNIRETEEEKPLSIVLDSDNSILDDILSDCLAQYTNEKETPISNWGNVKTKLSQINTRKLHYVKVPSNHIVVDFDLKDEDGNKSSELNLEAANKWPATYAEYSKGGSGIHLHYIFNGDISTLSNNYSSDIEIKLPIGNSSIRRKLTKCNNLPIATINSGLPLKTKGGNNVVNFDAITNEKAIRTLIEKNLKKEYHPGTASSVSFIHKILEDAHNSGINYDVTDMRPRILAFAANSTNQAETSVKLVTQMKFSSLETSIPHDDYIMDELVFFDVEVFPNLFVVVWKSESKDPVRMINPTRREIEQLFRFKLVGFNNRRYDNHILYAWYIGYTNQQLYELSQRIIKNSRNTMFGEAYNISYTDVYDFLSEKKGLKKLQIELGIHHKELGVPWDEPVSDDMWEKVVEYCVNDVVSLQAVFEAKKQDFIARLILSDLSGLTPNDTTANHTAKIIFGNDRSPQDKFVYTDLSKEFPGYIYEGGKSYYRGELTGEGGRVYAEPGMYFNVFVFDITSMHPTSADKLNIFGPYTKNYRELVDARVAIKHKEFDRAKTMLGGILSKYLTEGDSEALSYALKIVINIVYGLTSAKFENKFKDPRNKDNIVAKRGALFMIDLQHEVQKRGFQVVHIKTDSIKIPNATKEISDFIFEFGRKYGYEFEHEATYSRFCLVNDAVYIARYNEQGEITKGGKNANEWVSVGAQFSHPYVFKKLFVHKPILFEDMCETLSVVVGSGLYLDMNENLPEGEHNYHFVGKTGLFAPIQSGHGGGVLLREKEDKYHAASGTKGYRWMEAEMVKELKMEEYIDRSYYDKIVDKAIDTISKFGDFNLFVSKEKIIPPWCEAGPLNSKGCENCSEKIIDEQGTHCRINADIPF